MGKPPGPLPITEVPSISHTAYYKLTTTTKISALQAAAKGQNVLLAFRET